MLNTVQLILNVHALAGFTHAKAFRIINGHTFVVQTMMHKVHAMAAGKHLISHRSFENFFLCSKR